jgi:hypothetical protein
LLLILTEVFGIAGAGKEEPRALGNPRGYTVCYVEGRTTAWTESDEADITGTLNQGKRRIDVSLTSLKNAELCLAARRRQPPQFGTNDMSEYKGFHIDPFKSSAGRWRAHIRRSDGRKIKVAVPAGDEHDFIDTGMESFSAEATFEVAKKLIDGGGLNN